MSMWQDGDTVEYIIFHISFNSAFLTWDKHVENIVAKAGKRVYMLYQLKRAGYRPTLSIVTIYMSVFSNMHVPYGILT